MGVLLELARHATAAVPVPAAPRGAPCYRWNVICPSGRAIEVCYLPEVVRATVETDYPGAVVEPIAEEAD